MNTYSKAIVLSFALLISVAGSGLFAQYHGGTGTVSDPYQISAPAHLDNIRLNLAAHFILLNDIDLGVAPYNVLPGFSPIGTFFDFNDPGNAPFTGTLDGAGFTIANLLINRQSQNYVGFFGHTNGAVITGLNFSNLFVWGGLWMVGGLSGLDIGSSIENCQISGTVAGETRVGGFVGWSKGTYLDHCSFDNQIWSREGLSMGSIIGLAEDTILAWCDGSGNILGFSQIGGLVGEGARTLIRDSYSLCTFTTSAWTGGLIGLTYNEGQSIFNSYYNYDLALFNDHPWITPGALTNAHFTQWLANGRHLDVSDELVLENGKFLIQSLADFKLLWALGEDHAKSFRLTTDLDLAAEPEFCIPYFTGSFDGDGYTISNLNLTEQLSPQKGLFSLVEDAFIENLKVSNCSISMGHIVGPIAGKSSASTIKKCSTSGIINNYASACGGIVGESRGGSLIDQCSSSVSFNAWAYLGGLVGLNINSNINRSFYTGSIVGEVIIGGLASLNHAGGRIANSYVCGNIQGNLRTAGLVYSNESGSVIEDCYIYASVSCPVQGAALVMVSDPADVHRSYWNSDTSGQTESAGGFGRSTDQMTYPFDVDTYTGWDFSDIWSYDPQGLVNSGYPILRETPAGNPDEPALQAIVLSNYPNPFNPSTIISFDLPSFKEIELSIFNLKGQKVRSLASGIFSSGKHDLVWDGRDAEGRQVSSGVYLYRLSCAGQVITKRMTCIK